MQEYSAAETEVSALFQAVDKIFSQEAGVDFAVNARRTGCSRGRQESLLVGPLGFIPFQFEASRHIHQASLWIQLPARCVLYHTERD